MYVCIYIYIYIYIYVYMYACMLVATGTNTHAFVLCMRFLYVCGFCMYVCMHACMHVCSNSSESACDCFVYVLIACGICTQPRWIIYVCFVFGSWQHERTFSSQMYACMCVCMYVCVCVYIYIYIYILMCVYM